ncbi:MAG: HlyD family efflux transporter periplasmic adaptor subunit, partial [Paracoccus sp. (in: a-proteobacteria)]|nr:HlyD family efflux transporter periplasmic adaptor subunit [Paracoccus sp. (in: a-proteobacteria)]
DLARHRRERARQQRLQLTAQIAGIDAQIEAAAAQHRLIGAELDDQRHLLARGLTPAPRVRGLEREWSAAAGQLGELEALRAATELRITELDEALAQAEAEHRRAAETELRELSHQSRELREQAAAITSQLADLELRAPIDGIIHQLQVTGQGAVLRPAEPVMWIVPRAAPVVVSARVPAARIGEISPGQSARLSPRGHYWQDKPGLRGHISAISADAIADDPGQQGHFRIEVTLDETAPPDAPVIPGLTADLFIVTGTRSPLDYLATPLTRHFGRAMREL